MPVGTTKWDLIVVQLLVPLKSGSMRTLPIPPCIQALYALWFGFSWRQGRLWSYDCFHHHVNILLSLDTPARKMDYVSRTAVWLVSHEFGAALILQICLLRGMIFVYISLLTYIHFCSIQSDSYWCGWNDCLFAFNKTKWQISKKGSQSHPEKPSVRIQSFQKAKISNALRIENN